MENLPVSVQQIAIPTLPSSPMTLQLCQLLCKESPWQIFQLLLIEPPSPNLPTKDKQKTAIGQSANFYSAQANLPASSLGQLRGRCQLLSEQICQLWLGTHLSPQPICFLQIIMWQFLVSKSCWALLGNAKGGDNVQFIQQSTITCWSAMFGQQQCVSAKW